MRKIIIFLILATSFACINSNKNSFSDYEKEINQQLIINDSCFDSIKVKIDKLDLFEVDFITFSTQIDSMFKATKLIDNAPEIIEKYVIINANCYRAKLYYWYAFNHSLIKRQKYVLPDKFVEKVPKIPFDDSCALNLVGFKNFVDAYIDTKGKLMAEENPKAYTDYIFTNCKLDIVATEFKNEKLFNYALKEIMKSHLSAFGSYNTDSLLLRFNTICSNTNFKNEISELYRTAKEKNTDAKIESYKKREKYDLKAYIFAPKGIIKKPQPVVCCFFGGGWYEGTPEQFFDYCRYFIEKGYVAISFEYSIKGRFNATPVEGLQDVKSAIRWTRQHATEWNIDPNNLTAIGWSAGGHLVANAALANGFNDPTEDSILSEKPNKCVLIAPCFESMNDNWFFYQLGNKCDPKLLSPTQNIKKVNTHFLCLMGTKDEYNPLYTATDFEQLMQAQNNTCKLIIKEGFRHNGFMNKQGWEMIYDFISN